jgi:light-regulated signal transduction histidine kinase (bacteriophytochrome)
VLFLSLTAVGVGLLMAYVITRSITVPLQSAVTFANEIASGRENLTPEIPRQPELAQLITAMKEMYDSVHRSQAQLREMNADLARSNTELEQFAYIASHDLQEPLRMVTSYVQLLGKRYRGKLDPSADEYIAFAVDGTARMKQLINDLLAYSRVGRQEFHAQPVNANEVLDRVRLNLEPLIKERGATVTNDPLPTVLAEDIQLSQVLQNLIGNAIKFQGENLPRVHLSARREGESWVFSVADNGIGFDGSFSERIFQIFQRLHRGGEYPGTGIGLAICKKIVERFGGRIWVHSEVGKGSTFYFTIPIGGRGV